MKGKLHTNAGIEVSDEERASIEQEEKVSGKIEELERTAPRMAYQGEYNPRHDEFGNPNASLPKDFVSYDVTDLRKRRDEGKPVVPIWHVNDPETGEVVWVLSDTDRGAVDEGYICVNCLSWQASNIEMKCRTESGFSCGFVRSD